MSRAWLAARLQRFAANRPTREIASGGRPYLLRVYVAHWGGWRVYLREKAPDARLWDVEHDTSHVGEIDIPPMNSEEQAAFWVRFGGQDDARKTTELDAAEKLRAAEQSMLDAWQWVEKRLRGDR